MGRSWKRAQPHGPAPRQFLTRQLFFKWIKQHLRIKAFFGTNENAVKTQIWIAISVYVLVAIAKNVSASQRRSTQSYRFSASRFSRKHRWINCLTISLYKI